jgi:hypothetical protein
MRETNMKAKAQPTIGEITRNGRTRMGIALSSPAQKTMNGTMQEKGGSNEAAMRRMSPVDDIERNTFARRVSTAEKPKRQSLIHHHKSNTAPKTTPRVIKNSQRIQQNTESPTVLLRMKMGSRLRTSLLRT